jgi:alpha-tubulin suppressor-like RCC1 family protein
LGSAANSSPNTSPLQVGTDTDWKDVSAGDYFTCGVKTGGSLLCWGENEDGQLGRGTSNFAEAGDETPTEIGTDYASVTTGKIHACAINNSNEAFCWGGNDDSQCGNTGGATDCENAGQCFKTPTEVSGSLSTWTTLEAGGFFTCGMQDGSLECWGDNSDGQLGDTTNVEKSEPTSVSVGSMSGTATVSISAGWNHACAERNDGTVWCFGAGVDGQLGDGTNSQSATPVQTSASGAGLNVVGVGDYHSCANNTSYANGITISCWGRNGHGQVGDGSTTDTNIPVLLTLP